MRRMMLVTTAAALLLGLGATAQAEPVAAAPRAAAAQEQAKEQAAAAARTERAEVLALQPFVTTTGAVTTFDRSAALAAGRDPRVVAEFAAGVERGQQLPSSASSAAKLSAACPGITNGPNYRPFFYEMWINACDARALAALATAGGSVASIAGAIVSLTAVGAPIGVVLTIAAGIVAIGGADLQYCNRYGRGVVVRSYGYCGSQ